MCSCLGIPSLLRDAGPLQDGLLPLSLVPVPAELAALCLYLLGVDPPRAGCLSPALFGAGPLRDCYPPPALIPEELAASFLSPSGADPLLIQHLPLLLSPGELLVPVLSLS